jgi:hypothetical protein
MQTNNRGNQNKQIPSEQGRAAEQNTDLILSATPNNPGNDCAVKATLHHLSGKTSEIFLTMPRYSDWMEFLEDGQNAVREYVNQLTRHCVKITHFFIEFGKLLPDGSIHTSTSPRRYDVPVGKVFSPAKRGEWLSPEQHPHHPRYDQRGSSLELVDLAFIVSQRKEAVYSKLDDNTTLCGVPYESRGFYFRDGDMPSGTFEHEGATYVVVYSFVKTQEGGASC